MADDNATTPADAAPSDQPPLTYVAPSPHVPSTEMATHRMMLWVLVGLIPPVIMAVYHFRWFAVMQIGVAVLSCLAAEALFSAMRKRKPPLNDFSAAVTGVILALSLPWSAPWYIGVIGGVVAIGLGKAAFGGLGMNIFNPAMVGRAFVMIAFSGDLAAGAYVTTAQKAGELALSEVAAVSQATPLTAAKYGIAGGIPDSLWPMFLGNTAGSLGEVSALACLVGGLVLVLTRTASWQIPAGVILSVAALAGLNQLINPGAPDTLLYHLLGGALMFGAFFIATDPVSSPITPKGKWIFGIGVGVFIMVLRFWSAYPEGVMFAVLLMNALVPLINKISIPTPLGGPVPERKKG